MLFSFFLQVKWGLRYWEDQIRLGAFSIFSKEGREFKLWVKKMAFCSEASRGAIGWVSLIDGHAFCFMLEGTAALSYSSYWCKSKDFLLHGNFLLHSLCEQMS